MLKVASSSVGSCKLSPMVFNNRDLASLVSIMSTLTMSLPLPNSSEAWLSVLVTIKDPAFPLGIMLLTSHEELSTLSTTTSHFCSGSRRRSHCRIA